METVEKKCLLRKEKGYHTFREKKDYFLGNTHYTPSGVEYLDCQLFKNASSFRRY